MLYCYLPDVDYEDNDVVDGLLDERSHVVFPLVRHLTLDVHKGHVSVSKDRREAVKCET